MPAEIKFSIWFDPISLILQLPSTVLSQSWSLDSWEWFFSQCRENPFSRVHDDILLTLGPRKICPVALSAKQAEKPLKKNQKAKVNHLLPNYFLLRSHSSLDTWSRWSSWRTKLEQGPRRFWPGYSLIHFEIIMCIFFLWKKSDFYLAKISKVKAGPEFLSINYNEK